MKRSNHSFAQQVQILASTLRAEFIDFALILVRVSDYTRAIYDLVNNGRKEKPNFIHWNMKREQCIRYMVEWFSIYFSLFFQFLLHMVEQVESSKLHGLPIEKRNIRKPNFA